MTQATGAGRGIYPDVPTGHVRACRVPVPSIDPGQAISFTLVVARGYKQDLIGICSRLEVGELINVTEFSNLEHGSS